MLITFRAATLLFSAFAFSLLSPFRFRYDMPMLTMLDFFAAFRDFRSSPPPAITLFDDFAYALLPAAAMQ